MSVSCIPSLHTCVCAMYPIPSYLSVLCIPSLQICVCVVYLIHSHLCLCHVYNPFRPVSVPCIPFLHTCVCSVLVTSGQRNPDHSGMEKQVAVVIKPQKSRASDNSGMSRATSSDAISLALRAVCWPTANGSSWRLNHGHSAAP